MKKYLLILALGACTEIFAQSPEDALRFSFYPVNGTARYMSIGGTMGSLGGDITATYINPAGLGFYKTSEFVFTPGFAMNRNTINFRGTSSNVSNNNFSLGTTGWIFGGSSINNSRNSNALSIAINQTASFDNHIHYSGLNNYSSFSEQFAEEFAKSGYTIDAVLNTKTPFPYTSAVALYTYLIDTVKVNGAYQVKGAPEFILDAGQAIRQEMDQMTSGGIYETAIGFAHNSNDKWYFGGTLGIPFISYHSNTTFRENDTSNNVSNHFKSFEWKDDFKTTGIGFNGKLGIIYRPQDYIRIGLAIHTPTFMTLKDTRETSLQTSLENPVGNFNGSSKTFTNGQPGEAKYQQSAPWKAIISASYVFREVKDVRKQRAFISADIEYVNHKGSRFSSDNQDPTVAEKAYYTSLNNATKNYYKGAFNFRLGGELKFNILMARLGFAYYSNPYASGQNIKASKMLLSGGLGYRHKGIFFDLGYVYAINKDAQFPYRLEDRLNTFAETKQQRGNVVATLGLKF